MAQFYFKNGLRPIPVHYPLSTNQCSCKMYNTSQKHGIGKHPMMKGFNDPNVVIDESFIQDFWSKNPDANVGICAGSLSGNILYLDIDLHDPNKNGYESLHSLEEKYGKLPDTLRQRTGGGGEGRLYRVSNSDLLAKIKNETSICPGLDLRVTGGFFVAPPSIHASMSRYEWIEAHPIAEAPEWFVQYCIDASTKWKMKKISVQNTINTSPDLFAVDNDDCSRFDKLVHVIREATEGERNTLLNKCSFCAGKLIVSGIVQKDDAITKLIDAGLSTGLDHTEVENTVTRAVEDGMTKSDPLVLRETTMELQRKRGKFWDVDDSDKEKINVIFNIPKYFEFLDKSGYKKIYLHPKESTFVFIQNNIVEATSAERIKDYVFEYIEVLRSNLKNTEDEKENRIVLYKLISILKGPDFKMFRPERLQGLRTCNKPFQRDDKDTSYFYFQNCFVEVNRDEICCKPYSELKHLVWRSWIARCDFQTTEEESVFKRFISLTCNRDEQKSKALRTAIGYLLHKYKDPTVAKAVVLYDDNDSENPEGRTGKSLILSSIGHVRKVSIIDGKEMNDKDRFAFQSLDYDTEVVGLDDVKQNINFEHLFHRISAGFSIEKKYSEKKYVKFEDSPKIVITSNYFLDQLGGSAKARMMEYGLQPYFSYKHTPKDEFGHLFFNEWDSTEWTKFYNFMLGCCSEYLREGLLATTSTSDVDNRRIILNTSPEFCMWADHFFGCLFNWNEWVSSDVIYDSFLNYSDEFKRMSDKGSFSKNTFNKWLKIYATSKGIQFDLKIKRDSNISKRGFIFFEQIND